MNFIPSKTKVMDKINFLFSTYLAFKPSETQNSQKLKLQNIDFK